MISINIPCYNRSQLLKECVKSFLNQTFDDFEIIIVDDGSEEDLSAITLMDERIKMFRIEHSGISRSFNVALDHSSGEYIMPMGSDDLASDPNLLKLTFEEIKRREKRGYNVVYTDHWYMRGDGGLLRNKFHAAHQRFSQEECIRRMLEKSFISHGGALWQKDKMPRYDESLESAVDLELILTALERGVRFFHLPLRLWTYRCGEHPREGRSKRQIDACNIILGRRGYYFDKSTRRGKKICN